MTKTLDTERELYSREISFFKQAKIYIKIYKDRLFIAKVVKTLLQNSLSFLCALEVIETQDRYA